MYCQFHTCVSIRIQISSRTLVIPRTWVRDKKWFSTNKERPGGEWDRVAELWWSNSKKADTQFSEPRVRCPQERSRAKEVENYQYTSALMRWYDWNCFFAQWFLSISSVLCTEQSQTCLKNTVAVEQEQGDLLWQDKSTHCSKQPDCSF